MKKDNNDCIALNEAARFARANGDPEAALTHYEAIAAYYSSKNEILSSAHAIRHMADIYCEQGRLGEAAAAYARVLRMHSEAGDSHSLNLANAMRGYALLMNQIEDQARARVFWAQARSLYQETGVEAGIEECDLWLEGLGDPKGEAT